MILTKIAVKEKRLMKQELWQVVTTSFIANKMCPVETTRTTIINSNVIVVYEPF